MTRRKGEAPEFGAYKVYNVVIESSLSQTQRDIVICLGFLRDPDTGIVNSNRNPEFWKSNIDIAARIGVKAKRTVELNMKALRAMGIVEDVPRAEMPHRAKHTYRNTHGWFRLNLDKVPRQTISDPRSLVADDDLPDDEATSEPGSLVEELEPESPAIDDRQSPAPDTVTDDRGSATSDRRSAPLGSDLSISDRSIDRPHPNPLVAEALQIAAELCVTLRIGVRLDGKPSLDHHDIRRITSRIMVGEMKPDDLRAVGVWLEAEDRRELDLQRRKGHVPHWQGHHRTWNVLLKNPVELRRRIDDGTRIECQRAQLVELPRRPEPELALEHDETWWREELEREPEAITWLSFPAELRETIWRERIAEDPAWAHDPGCPRQLFVPRPPPEPPPPPPPAKIPAAMQARIADARRRVGMPSS